MIYFLRITTVKTTEVNIKMMHSNKPRVHSFLSLVHPSN